MTTKKLGFKIEIDSLIALLGKESDDDLDDIDDEFEEYDDSIVDVKFVTPKLEKADDKPSNEIIFEPQQKHTNTTNSQVKLKEITLDPPPPDDCCCDIDVDAKPVELNLAPIKIESSSEEDDESDIDADCGENVDIGRCSNNKHAASGIISKDNVKPVGLDWNPDPNDPLGIKREEIENNSLKHQKTRSDDLKCDDFDSDDEIPLENIRNGMKKRKLCEIGETARQCERFFCELCPKSYTKKYALHMHMAVHENRKPYVCEICDKSFTLLSILKGHKRIHTKEVVASCEICQKNFNSKSNYRSHLKTHSDMRRFACETCGAMFKSKNTMILHQKRHLGIKPYKCDQCGKCFIEAFEVKVHARIHTGIRPHKCEICSKGFLKLWMLKKHMSAHSNERPFVCGRCNESFKRKESLTKHVSRNCITHGRKGIKDPTVPKAYVCEICQHGCHTNQGLKEHKVTKHSWRFPYPCMVCDKTFALKSGLVKHLKSHSISQEDILYLKEKLL